MRAEFVARNVTLLRRSKEKAASALIERESRSVINLGVCVYKCTLRSEREAGSFQDLASNRENAFSPQGSHAEEINGLKLT